MITTSAQQGGYLAGILAAKSTKSGTVGIVISASDTNWYEMSGGFAAGVRSVSPSTKIVFATIGPAAYDDAAGGKRVATSVIAAGADVIFGMGDGASLGYIQAVETAKKKTWYIGDIGNIAPIDKKKIQLSSVLWNFTDAYKTAINQINGGTFGTKAYNLTLTNGGISLLKTRYASRRDLGARRQGAEGDHRGYGQGAADDDQGRSRQARQELDRPTSPRALQVRAAARPPLSPSLP